MDKIETQTPEGTLEITNQDYSTLPDCPPSNYNVTELYNTPEEHRHNLPKYYASEILNITENSMPDMQIFIKKREDFTDQEWKIGAQHSALILQLLAANDICDKNGILFLSKFFQLAHEHVNEQTKAAIADLKVYKKNEVLKYALAQIKNKNA